MAGSFSLDQIRALYDRFDAPVTPIDCGAKCAPYNPTGKPFCCDICQAVPAAYHQEWEYLRRHTDLWHEWRGDECPSDPSDPASLRLETPEHMRLLACQGPAHCQRAYRLLGCRQFPFFPYVTSGLRFIGLAYEWAFESMCWVISNLGQVTEAYRREFVQVYDDLLSRSLEDLDSYALLSDEMRQHFVTQKRRIPILHRNGGYYLLSPFSERLSRGTPELLARFSPYRDAAAPPRNPPCP